MYVVNDTAPQGHCVRACSELLLLWPTPSVRTGISLASYSQLCVHRRLAIASPYATCVTTDVSGSFSN